MWTLFVVALVALGLMATVSLNNGVTGDAIRGSRAGPIGSNLPTGNAGPETVNVYQDTTDDVAYVYSEDYEQLQNEVFEVQAQQQVQLKLTCLLFKNAEYELPAQCVGLV